MTQEYDDLEYMTRKLIKECKVGIRSKSKTIEYMCIGGTQTHLELIKHCNRYKYLGMYITLEGTTDEAIRHRIIQGRRVIMQLNSIQCYKNGFFKSDRGKIKTGADQK